MAITSAEIHNQSFSIDRKGYDVDEVDVFLEHVADEIDGMTPRSPNSRTSWTIVSSKASTRRLASKLPSS